MSKRVINVYDAAVSRTLAHGESFDAKMAPLAEMIGGRQIGANVTRVPPGKAVFSFHHHYANEEHFFIIRGTGVLRCGDETHPVRAGDYIVNPAGGPEHAHQLVNTGGEELMYLALSTLLTPEIVGYPDSQKIGVRPEAYSPTGKRWLIPNGELDKTQYFDGEDGAQVRAVVDKARP